MKIDQIFTSFIARDSLIDIPNIDNDAIVRVCEENEKRMVGLGAGSRSNFFDQNHPAIQPLIQEIGGRLNVVYQTYCGMSPKTRLKVDRVWSNVNNNYNIDIPHCHRKSFLSAVYYPKANLRQGSGCFNIMTPAQGAALKIDMEQIQTWNTFNSDLWVETPETGKLIIFPSWLFHYVSPTLAGDERISIAFDTVIEDYDQNN